MALARKMHLPPHWRRLLFIFWFVCSYGWMITTAKRFDLDSTMQVFSAYQLYGNKIVEGRASQYERDLYRNYRPRLEAAQKTFAVFFFVGIGLPCVVLGGGTWLLRTKKKPPLRKKPPR